jgi:alginate O-acetyltransferase complex protein AlgI
LGMAIEKSHSKRIKRILFLGGIILNILLLGYFKYSHFIIEQILLYVSNEGLKQFLAKSIILPVGISFITFQRISYLTDVYTSKTKSEKNILRYAVYALIFPHLIAGPIVRYVEIKDELKKRILTHENFYMGIKLFAVGIFLKVFLADQFFLIEEYLMPLLKSLDTLLSLVLVFTFSLRLYFDFLGYSLMAIGIASILGFHFPDNFDSPYSATSITNFWRRWNITLSNWIRDYVYIPLGGNRKGEIRAAINLLLAMLFAGLWHGAGWNFIIWGGLHGIFMAIERVFKKISFTLSRRLSQVVTFTLVSFLWIIFRFTKLEDIQTLIHNLSRLTFFDMSQLTQNTIMTAFPAFLIAFYWIIAIKEKKLRDDHPSLLKLTLFSVLLFGTILFSFTRRSISFIYFQF